MKRIIATFCLLASAAVADTDTEAKLDQLIEELRAQRTTEEPIADIIGGVDEDGWSAVVTVDAFKAMANTRVQRSRWYARPFVALAEATKQLVREPVDHPFQTLALALTAVALHNEWPEEVADWVSGDDDDDDPPAGPDTARPYLLVEGDENVVSAEDRPLPEQVTVRGNRNKLDFDEYEDE